MTDEEKALVALSGWPRPGNVCRCGHASRRRPYTPWGNGGQLCVCCAQAKLAKVVAGITPYLYRCDGTLRPVLDDGHTASPP